MGALCACLGIEIEPGEVVFSVPAQLHALRNHPDDFPRCLPHTGSVIASPLYAGDDFRNPGKIELISRIPALGSGLLVVIALKRDANGCYNVASLYPITISKIEGRLSKGFLKRVVK